MKEEPASTSKNLDEDAERMRRRRGAKAKDVNLASAKRHTHCVRVGVCVWACVTCAYGFLAWEIWKVSDQVPVSPTLRSKLDVNQRESGARGEYTYQSRVTRRGTARRRANRWGGSVRVCLCGRSHPARFKLNETGPLKVRAEWAGTCLDFVCG